MEFETYPEVEFETISLSDEPRMIKMFLEMLDRGVLSYKSTIEKLGFNYEQQLSEMKDELELIDDGVLGRKQSPYHGRTGEETKDTNRPSEVPGEYPDRQAPESDGVDASDARCDTTKKEDEMKPSKTRKKKTQKSKAGAESDA